MKVLVTGASGFVGSHILDALRAQGIPASALLRPTSNPRFLGADRTGLDVRLGSIDDPASLDAAMADATHVLHCAGCTKALRLDEFDRVNRIGTRNVVDAVNRQGGRLSRLVHVSSLAAAGPAGADAPSRETEPPHPVSIYGRSKLAGEREVGSACGIEYVILRPAAVYGPRDGDFLRVFKAVRSHLLPRPAPMPLSLLYVRDLADAAVVSLTHPSAAGKIFNVGSPVVSSARAMAAEVAAQMATWTVPLPVPTIALWPMGCIQDVLSRLSGRPNALSRQKYPELRAAGWVCDPSRMQAELGTNCRTTLEAGIAETLRWYRQNGWL